MSYISLTKGKETLIDDEWVDRISKYKWCFDGHYAATRTKNKKIRLHTLLIDVPNGYIVDHINRNRLDNRRVNLRLVTMQQNIWNQRKRPGNSIYKGVCWNKRRKEWITQISKNNLKFVGYFKNEIHAALAYDIWAKELQGEYAYLNFPNAIHG